MKNRKKEQKQKVAIDLNSKYSDKFKPVLGKFRKHRLFLECPSCKTIQKFTAQNEKYTDVNLASDLVQDCYSQDFECVTVVSNDSDYSKPLEIARNEGKYVILMSPVLESRGYKITSDLTSNADEHIILDRRIMKKHLFNNRLHQ